MIFDVINPSDSYTLESNDFKTACMACLWLGHGQYGLQEVGGDRFMPVMFLNDKKDRDAWAQKEFKNSFDEFTESISLADIADCLDTVLVGSPQDREEYTQTCKSFDDPNALLDYQKTYKDKRRGSMNNIGDQAAGLAKLMRERVKEEKSVGVG